MVTKIRSRKRSNKPPLEKVIIGAILSSFSYSGYGDEVLRDPEMIKVAMLNLVNNDQLWEGLQKMAEATAMLERVKNGY